MSTGVLWLLTGMEWHVASYQVGWAGHQKTIIRGIAGKMQPGDFTALLGPSGAGKTSLVQCLSLRTRSFEGAVCYNGQPPGSDFFANSAVVFQKENMFGFMTTREHLTFQAMARMSSTHTTQQIAARVDEVLHEARLQKCAGTIVGSTSPFFLKRGLSGGERKRVAIATELILCPQLIFLDEPTTGLDSVTSAIIVNLLKDLSTRGRMILASIHCPSSELMKHFTHILLLTHDGRLAFHGPRSEAVRHFEKLGYEYPTDYNPADFYLEVLSRWPQVAAKEEAARGAAIVQAFQRTPWAIKSPLPCSDEHKVYKPTQKLGASHLTLLRINSWRSFILLTRDKVNFMLWILVDVLVGVLFSVVFLNQASTTWRNLTGLTFSLAVTAVMLGTLSELFTFPHEWAPVSREVMGGSNAIGPYLLSRYAHTLPMLIGPLLMTTIIYWMTGMDSSFVAYVKFTATMLLCMATSIALGICCSCFSHNASVGFTILLGTLVPMIMFSGMLYQRGTMPAYLSWIENVSVVNYTFSALLIQQYHILGDDSGITILKFLVIDPADLNHDIAMMFAIFVGINLITYTTLHVRMRNTAEWIM